MRINLIATLAAMIVILLLATAEQVPAIPLEAPHKYDMSVVPQRNFSCNYCHITGRRTGLKSLQNLCTGCHTSSTYLPLIGGSNYRSYFALGEASNVFKTITTQTYKQIANPSMLSHNWAGKETNPAAGATAPAGTSKLYKTAINGTVSCARCHYVHSSGTDYTSNKPILRMVNDEDQMCFECHQQRNTRLSSSGSHPVRFNYASSAALRPTWLKPTPTNSNPANPTADLSRYLKKGRVVCSTCHKLHKADSNSATYDSYTASQLAPPATVAKGKGMLLRTDFRRTLSSDPNICQNCHTYMNHNKRAGQDLQCTDCHGAHVTNDLSQNYISGQPNTFLVGRYINYSAVVRGVNVRSRAVFRLTTSNSELYKADDSGLCQICHNAATTNKGVHTSHIVGGVLDPAYEKCKSCHPHTGTSSFTPNGAAACGSCHGRPPRVNSPGNKKYAGYVDGGYAVYTSGTTNGYSYATAKNGAQNIIKDESVTPHWRHSAGVYDTDLYNYGLACDECHKGNNHRTMSYQEVFLASADFPNTHPRPGDAINVTQAGLFGKAKPGYTSTTSTTGTCSSVYCHSNAAPRNATLNIYTGIVYKTIPLWPGGSTGEGTISASAGNRCNACHGNSATLVTNSHAKHRDVSTGNAVMGSSITCNVCHKTALSLTNYTTIDYTGTLHVNGRKDVAFAAPYDAAPMTWTVGSGNCSGACHANGVGTGYGAGVAATWGITASSRCGLCHAFPPATGAHTAHMPSVPNQNQLHKSYTSASVTSIAGDYIFGCANCHPKDIAKHINGTVDVTLNKNQTGPLKSRNTVTDDTSGWSRNAGKLYCFASYCHSNGANGVSATFKAYSSPDWYATFTGDKCAMCHGNSPNSGGRIGSPAHYNPNSMGTGKTGGHFVGIHYADIYSGGTGKAAAANTAIGSHGNSATATTISCNTCHNSTVTSSANDKNVVCATCHGAGAPLLNPAELIASKAAHLNGSIDVVFNGAQVKSKAQMRQKSFELYSAAVLKRYPTNSDYKTSGAYDQGKNAIAAGMWTSGTRTCSNISCHNGVSITWIEIMTVNTCSNCHNAL